ncbi:hypothetical protein DE146DRAFT_663725 [Phaeosphaeria sp. MPI-PUGE-AT-0046c]|nr:hypothetical protein DE146DRAFT_663725 [Phaeosphaeria sp. MPI-PUGE-AT-0046c]
MVNPGHPSRGCATCKKRRIRCDERKPTCTHCARAKRPCLGYISSDLTGPSTRTKQVEEVQLSISRQAPGRYRRLAIADRYDRRDELPMLSVVYDTIISAFTALQEEVHTIDTHRALQKRYQDAMQRLRTMLNVADSHDEACVSAHAFALYEMAVSTSISDKIWLTHFLGFIALLQSQASSSTHPFGTLICALRIVDDLPTPCPLPSEEHYNGPNDIYLAAAMLRFHQNVSTQYARPVTKLEATKRRQELRRIYTHLELLPTAISGVAVRILAANSLADVSKTLSPQFTTTPQYIKLVDSIKGDSDQLVELCRAEIPGLNLIWPLYAASIGHGLTEKRRREIRNMIRRMGEDAKVPLGIALGAEDDDMSKIRQLDNQRL